MQKRPVLIWLIVSQAMLVLSLVPWVVMAGLAVMAFDAPGSEKLAGPWIFVGTIWSYPLWLLAAAIISWVLYARRHLRAAAIVTAAPLMVVLTLGLLLFGLG